MEPATPTSSTAPAFKILPLLALALAFGCHAADSHESAPGTSPATTAMLEARPSALSSAARGPASNDASSAAQTACGTHQGSSCTAEERARAAATRELPPSGSSQVGKYGAPLGAARSESLASVLAEPARYAGEPLRVEGHVRRACTAMGCWMELAESRADDAPGCRVIMKDHAFFVPTNSAGSNARVEGTLSVRRIEPAQVAHMESEGASFPHKAADGSADEVRFVASGVELWRGS